MNDLGLDPAIQSGRKDVEPDETHDKAQLERDEEGDEQEERDFLDPSRWWFASTASPLIAGTFGPIASSFSICALVQKWRVYIPPGENETLGILVADPGWLIGINALSLALAVLANLFLLLNMARRVPFAIGQSISVVGFFSAGILLVGLVSAASTTAFEGDSGTGNVLKKHALTQAFYYGIFAAGLYLIIGCLLAVTVYGAWKGHYEKEFQLTVSQRTLMLQTMVFMGYLMLGALIYSHIEGWQFLDALYWADFTLLTIGIGDFYVPTTHLGRGLLFPFAVGGIVTLGLVVSSIRSMALESAKEKLAARMTEKKREMVLKSINVEKGSYRLDWFSTRRFNINPDRPEISKRQQQFEAMRQIQDRSQRNRQWASLAFSSLAVAALWFGGAAIFQQTEKEQGFSYFVSLYFSYTTLLTIGYGDFQPVSNSGKPFFVFWSLLAIPALTILISNMGDTVVKAIADLTLWLGSFTVLPGEEGVRGAIRSQLKIFRNDLEQSEDHDIQQPGNFLPLRRKKHQHHGEPKDLIPERMDEEMRAAEKLGLESHPDDKDRRFYDFILIKEIRRVLIDLDASPPKRYTYSEWAYYLKLLGQDEANPELHSKPPKAFPKKKKDGFGVFNLAHDLDDDGKAEAWNWLGIKSPLMSGKNESEWILHRLLVRLQSNLHLSSYDNPKKPPISLAKFLSTPNGAETSLMNGEKRAKNE